MRFTTVNAFLTVMARVALLGLIGLPLQGYAQSAYPMQYALPRRYAYYYPPRYQPVYSSAQYLSPSQSSGMGGRVFFSGYGRNSGEASGEVPGGQSSVMQSGIQRYGVNPTNPMNPVTGATPQQILQSLIVKNGLSPGIVNEIRFSDQNVLNSWTDGQNIFMTRMLWNRLANNDEKAFVIGHELSHIILHHILQTQIRHVGLSLVDQFIAERFAQPGTLLNMATNAGLGLIDKKYSRSEEYQADDYGLRLLTHAGYNPQGAMQTFKMLSQSGGSSSLPEFLQDHPITEDRIKALVAKYRLTE